jgi:hypothetical protein
MDVKVDGKLNRGKEWCDMNHLPCDLINPDDVLDNGDFNRVNDLIHQQKHLETKLNLKKIEEKTSSVPFTPSALGSSSSCSSSSSSFSSEDELNAIIGDELF